MDCSRPVEELKESSDSEKHPHVAMYGPCNIRELKEGVVKLWCTCGLSSKQPWCDGSHKGTAFMPLTWKVPKRQSLFQLCACKYTRDPPFCDATHTSLPCQVVERQRHCAKVDQHTKETKLCSGCGWIPDF